MGAILADAPTPVAGIAPLSLGQPHGVNMVGPMRQDDPLFPLLSSRLHTRYFLV